jgi:hypothetical protein
MRALVVVALLLAVFTGPSCGATQKPAPDQKPAPEGTAEHDEALRRAKVWLEPAVPIEEARLGENPAGDVTFARDEQVVCSFKPDFTSGSTPKFECERPNGKKIKVKYGRENEEIYAEVAASRLLAALGFPADRMYVVERIRCFGCPSDPFNGLQCLNEGGSVESCFAKIDYDQYVDFDYAIIERRLEGEKLETKKVRGWGWDELSKIDASAGGASRAEVDALRLLAVFLAHWDNKPKNQRLLCVGEDSPDEGELPDCDRPIAMVQDLGATFGPFKFDVNGWEESPVWKDAAACTVSMRHLPYGGSSFPDTQISEEGRAFLASRLAKLSTQQIRELFEGARATRIGNTGNIKTKSTGGTGVDRWVGVFQNKVRAIVERAPCPAAS